MHLYHIAREVVFQATLANRDAVVVSAAGSMWGGRFEVIAEASRIFTELGGLCYGAEDDV